MTALLRSIALVVSMTACFDDSGDNHGIQPGGGGSGGSGGSGSGSGSGSNHPPPNHRGRQTMSDVHAHPNGEQVWMVHSAIADTTATPRVTTAHFGVYLPASSEFFDVLDTTGTLGKKILFPSHDRVLYVTRRGTTQDVFVTVDTVARKPVKQRSYPGDRIDFELSPTGRLVLATDNTDSTLHVLDTESLVDRALPGMVSPDEARWAPGDDQLYVLRTGDTATDLVRFDLRDADIATSFPPASVVASVAGAGQWLVVSPTGKYAAFNATSGQASVIAMVDLTTATTKTVDGDLIPAFTNDDRVIVWRAQADSTQEFRIVDPVTGTATPAVATTQIVPVAVPLRRHDLVIIESIFGDNPYLYKLADGTRTPILDLYWLTSMFERPGHDELWLWFNHDDTLRRLDLGTGGTAAIVTGVDSVDYRAATDDIIVGTYDHSVERLSMATGQLIGRPLVLADPNDSTAPYKLAGN